jgi:hypothetical protein
MISFIDKFFGYSYLDKLKEAVNNNLIDLNTLREFYSEALNQAGYTDLAKLLNRKNSKNLNVDFIKVISAYVYDRQYSNDIDNNVADHVDGILFSEETNQRSTGDCWLVAFLQAASKNDEFVQYYSSCIKIDKEKQTYTIHLWNEDFTYTFDEINSANELVLGDDMDVRVLEMAMRDIMALAGNQSIRGGTVSDAATYLTGSPYNSFVRQKNMTQDDYVRFFEHMRTGSYIGVTSLNANQKSEVTIKNTLNNQSVSIPPAHAFAVVGIDEDAIYIVNPYFSKEIIGVSYKDFMEKFTTQEMNASTLVDAMKMLNREVVSAEETGPVVTASLKESYTDSQGNVWGSLADCIRANMLGKTWEEFYNKQSDDKPIPEESSYTGETAQKPEIPNKNDYDDGENAENILDTVKFVNDDDNNDENNTTENATENNSVNNLETLTPNDGNANNTENAVNQSDNDNQYAPNDTQSDNGVPGMEYGPGHPDYDALHGDEQPAYILVDQGSFDYSKWIFGNNPPKANIDENVSRNWYVWSPEERASWIREYVQQCLQEKYGDIDGLKVDVSVIDGIVSFRVSTDSLGVLDLPSDVIDTEELNAWLNGVANNSSNDIASLLFVGTGYDTDTTENTSYETELISDADGNQIGTKTTKPDGSSYVITKLPDGTEVEISYDANGNKIFEKKTKTDNFGITIDETSYIDGNEFSAHTQISPWGDITTTNYMLKNGQKVKTSEITTSNDGKNAKGKIYYYDNTGKLIATNDVTKTNDDIIQITRDNNGNILNATYDIKNNDNGNTSILKYEFNDDGTCKTSLQIFDKNANNITKTISEKDMQEILDSIFIYFGKDAQNAFCELFGIDNSAIYNRSADITNSYFDDYEGSHFGDAMGLIGITDRNYLINQWSSFIWDPYNCLGSSGGGGRKQEDDRLAPEKR